MTGERKAFIDLAQCYECGVCQMVQVCPTDALVYQEMTEDRLTRYYFNNVLVKHPVTKMTGRGTAEMKTNEVTNRYKHGEAGFGVEIGRPDVGATFRDVQTVAMALAGAGVTFEPGAPTTLLMEDPERGTIADEILDERIICAIIEFTIKTEKLAEILRVLDNVSKEIDTVFSIDLITRTEPDGRLPNLEIVAEEGYEVRPNAKATIGLGRVSNPGKEV